MTLRPFIYIKTTEITDIGRSFILNNRLLTYIIVQNPFILYNFAANMIFIKQFSWKR